MLLLQVLSASACLRNDAPSRGGAYTTDFSEAQLTFDPEDVTPTYRVMNSNGSILDPSNDPQVGGATYRWVGPSVSPALILQLEEAMLLKMHRKMVALTRVDLGLYKAKQMVGVRVRDGRWWLYPVPFL